MECKTLAIPSNCEPVREPPEVAIVVFARFPTPGRVKTRLAAGPGVGPLKACEFYCACAQHAIHQALSCADWASVYIYHSSADDSSQVAEWLASEDMLLPCIPQLGPHGMNLQRQQDSNPDVSCTRGDTSGRDAVGTDGGTSSTWTDAGGQTNIRADAAPAPAPDPDLGAKMIAAMSDAMQRSGASKVIIMGTDIPDLSAQLLRRAADALDDHQMVLGPALDGGYYLMGLTRLEPRLFQDMVWSTDTVLRETLARAAAAGLVVAPLEWLPFLRDVDTVQDLAEWLGSCNDQEVAAEQPSTSSPQTGAVEDPVQSTCQACSFASTQAKAARTLRQRRIQLVEVSRGVLEGAAADQATGQVQAF